MNELDKLLKLIRHIILGFLYGFLILTILSVFAFLIFVWFSMSA